MPVEQVPQIVLITFDDSVNDLNKQLYIDLFEKDRVNPNSTPRGGNSARSSFATPGLSVHSQFNHFIYIIYFFDTNFLFYR